MNKKTFIIVACVLVIFFVAYFFAKNKPNNFNEPDQTIQEVITTEPKISETGISNPQVSVSNNNDEKDIQYSFEQYKNAILGKNSSLAIKYLNQTTISYYADMLNLVKKGTKTEIQNRRLIDQMSVLIVRHQFDTTTITKLNNGTDMLTLAINQGLIGEQSVSGLFVNSIKVSGSTAFVEVNTEHGVAPQKLKFVKEDGMWKLDLTSILPETNIILKSLVKDSDLTEEEFIFQILESQSGIKPSSIIWQPISS